MNHKPPAAKPRPTPNMLHIEAHETMATEQIYKMYIYAITNILYCIQLDNSIGMNADTIQAKSEPNMWRFSPTLTYMNQHRYSNKSNDHHMLRGQRYHRCRRTTHNNTTWNSFHRATTRNHHHHARGILKILRSIVHTATCWLVLGVVKASACLWKIFPRSPHC